MVATITQQCHSLRCGLDAYLMLQTCLQPDPQATDIMGLEYLFHLIRSREFGTLGRLAHHLLLHLLRIQT